MAPTLSPPTLTRLVIAAIISVVSSLGVDSLLIKAITTIYPSIRGFSHFRVSDYGSLTVIGIVIACAAWPVTINTSSLPRRLFLRLAIVATIFLWIPDGWLLLRHEPFSAVGTLMMMHLAIAFITYNALTRIAVPQQLHSNAQEDQDQYKALSMTQIETEEKSRTGRGVRSSTVHRSIWIFLLSASCFEFIIGVAALILVPYGRPNAWIPARGEFVYLTHAILGGILSIGAYGVLVPALKESRITRIGSIVGCSGVTIGAVGGMLAISHSLRLIGMALMLVGVALAFFGYLTPIIEPSRPGSERT